MLYLRYKPYIKLDCNELTWLPTFEVLKWPAYIYVSATNMLNQLYTGWWGGGGDVCVCVCV
jgi:hypothetical protein